MNIFKEIFETDWKYKNPYAKEIAKRGKSLRIMAEIIK